MANLEGDHPSHQLKMQETQKALGILPQLLTVFPCCPNFLLRKPSTLELGSSLLLTFTWGTWE